MERVVESLKEADMQKSPISYWAKGTFLQRLSLI